MEGLTEGILWKVSSSGRPARPQRKPFWEASPEEPSGGASKRGPFGKPAHRRTPLDVNDGGDGALPGPLFSLARRASRTQAPRTGAGQRKTSDLSPMPLQELQTNAWPRRRAASPPRPPPWAWRAQNTVNTLTSPLDHRQQLKRTARARETLRRPLTPLSGPPWRQQGAGSELSCWRCSS